MRLSSLLVRRCAVEHCRSVPPVLVHAQEVEAIWTKYLRGPSRPGTHSWPGGCGHAWTRKAMDAQVWPTSRPSYPHRLRVCASFGAHDLPRPCRKTIGAGFQASRQSSMDAYRQKGSIAWDEWHVASSDIIPRYYRGTMTMLAQPGDALCAPCSVSTRCAQCVPFPCQSCRANWGCETWSVVSVRGETYAIRVDLLREQKTYVPQWGLVVQTESCHAAVPWARPP